MLLRNPFFLFGWKSVSDQSRDRITISTVFNLAKITLSRVDNRHHEAIVISSGDETAH